MSPSEEPPRRRSCAQMVVHELLVETQPEYRERRLEAEELTRESINTGEAQRIVAKLVTIPVVVHVVLRDRSPNVTDAQIKGQIDSLNRDFRARNRDKTKVPAVWKGLVVDSKIQFALAKKDPRGRPTTGITRTATTVAAFGPDDSVKSRSTGGVNPWPADRYLNMWVCRLGGGLLGYAQFPGGPSETDGVVIRNTAFGTTGTAEPPFNLGRTGTHEVGHFLNLYHIWGLYDDCTGGDMVSDTPNAAGPNYGEPGFPQVSCNNGPNGDMFMNFMDYVDDRVMCMFTAQQVARMMATLDGPRSALGRS